MHRYEPTKIEPKWQQKWSEDGLYKVNLQDQSKPPFYLLVEFTYPSGDLHIGHWFAFAVPDVLGRFKRMQGFQVFYPNGFDAFGLPAENAAIKRGIHPKDWTYANIERMKSQFAKMGAIHSWEHTLNSCDPEYYKWNQWIFLKMLGRGLAYRGSALSNWCPNCQTVLANENVEAGLCWRCSTEVVQKDVAQWFFKITDYADRLIWHNVPSVDWPKSIIDGQNNWIGKSEGVEIQFKIQNSKLKINVYTTRPDTLFGATFIVINPEHSLLVNSKSAEVGAYLKEAKKKSEMERRESREKTGVFTNLHAVHPLNGALIPIWVADYVLSSYGTGAVMGVPGHDARDHEFAKKYELPILTVIASETDNSHQKVYEGEGVLTNSGEYNGLSSAIAREKLSDYIEKHNIGIKKANYHLHDWSISRQRYWGTPIPIINCDPPAGGCGAVPVPEEDLPVELPYEVEYAPTGKPPLATAESWVNVKCPRCGKPARRETETMDTFVDSSWYFLRYPSTRSVRSGQVPFDPEITKKWLPVNIYFGGAEHTLGHTLYSRFFTKFFQDLGLVEFAEYAKRRVNHGVILGPDGSRMSKSRGNVVNPDEQVASYGADAVRLYLSFLGPYDLVAPWKPEGIHGVYRFLERVWNLTDKVEDELELTNKDLQLMHKVIKKVGLEIDSIKFNTAVAALMEWLNHLSRKESLSKEEYKTFLLLLAPFAPHITEELWSILKETSSIHSQDWPKFEDKYLVTEEVQIVVQVNGKVRDTLLIAQDILNEESEVVRKALDSPKIQKNIQEKVIKKQIYIPGRVLNFVV